SGLCKLQFFGPVADPAMDLQSGLDLAYLHFKAFCKVYKKDGSTMLTAKAYNGRIILQWLSACLSEAAQADHYRAQDDRLPLMACCATQLALFFGISERCGRVLREEDAQSMYRAGHRFCSAYVALSKVSIRNRSDLFRLRPKIHVPDLHHQLTHVAYCTRACNQHSPC
ncbi:unnamed protein product, partial [Effrenium voratum]